MNKIKELLEIAQEKNIPNNELNVAINTFMSSATSQAMEQCGLTKEKLESLDLDNLETDMLNAKSVNEIADLNLQFNKKVSSENTEFLKITREIFDQLLTTFIEKIKLIDKVN